MDTILLIALIAQWAAGWGWMEGQLVLVCLMVWLTSADVISRLRRI